VLALALILSSSEAYAREVLPEYMLDAAMHRFENELDLDGETEPVGVDARVEAAHEGVRLRIVRENQLHLVGKRPISVRDP
jgi:hypothetical protein